MTIGLVSNFSLIDILVSYYKGNTELEKILLLLKLNSYLIFNIVPFSLSPSSKLIF